jgi:endoglucanase
LPLLNGDQGIIYEMFNEPRQAPTRSNWQEWASAMNKVVSTIRASGATNTLVADGLNFAETLDGVVPLDDRNVIYSSHPYFHKPEDQNDTTWARKFGDVAATLPVIVGEWTSATTYYCDSASTPTAALGMLKYLQSREIGLVAVTYDFGLPRYGGIVSDYNGTPTTFANHVGCREVGFGPGTLVQQWYRTGSLPNELQ